MMNNLIHQNYSIPPRDFLLAGLFVVDDVDVMQ